jgi:hypothetical protein
MKGERSDQQHERTSHTAPQEQRDGCGTQREGEDARVKVPLERVRAGSRDGVAKREGGEQRDRGPRVTVETDPDQPDAPPQEHERGHIRDDTNRGQRCAGDPDGRRDDLVDSGQPVLRAEHGRVMREEVRVQLQQRRGQVERLVRRSVPIPAGIQGRENDERNDAEGKDQRGDPARSRGVGS